MSDLYPCQGTRYEGQREAMEALELHRHQGLRNHLFEVEQPYTYRCIEGHWHYSLIQRARPSLA